MEFVNLKGETLVKAPGSINGESFSLKNLEECSVFILDYSSEVEITNCTNCQIFIGPVDGPAIFESCSNCQVAVACHLFKANACTSCEFGLYSSTQPAISASSGIRIACWSGAYPLLTQHFEAANLDPTNNQWNKVYDASAEEGGAPNFELVAEQPAYWEVPLDSFGPPENPVPGPDGTLYQGPAAAPGAQQQEPAAEDEFSFEAPPAAAAAAAAAAPAEPTENGTGGAFAAAAAGGAISDDFLAAGGEHVPSADVETLSSGMLEPEATGGDHPRVAAAKQRLQQRLREQAQTEAEQKQGILSSAGQYLEQFYERRNKGKEDRIRAGREALEGRGNGESGPAGSNQWERTLSMIDFNLSRPNGTDLSRFKSVMFTCKSKGALPAAA